MAKTYPKREMTVIYPSDPWFGLLEQKGFSALAATFQRGWPVVLTGGLVDNYPAGGGATLIYGFAIDPATTPASAGAPIRYVLARDSMVRLEANLLGAAGADRVFLVTDIGALQTLDAAAVGPSASTIWYFETLGANGHVRVQEARAYMTTLPDQEESDPVPQGPPTPPFPVVGDSNARVTASVNAAFAVP